MKLPPVASRYSIIGLAVNIHSFEHILINAEFTVIIDPLALQYILNAKKKNLPP